MAFRIRIEITRLDNPKLDFNWIGTIFHPLCGILGSGVKCLETIFEDRGTPRHRCGGHDKKGLSFCSGRIRMADGPGYAGGPLSATGGKGNAFLCFFGWGLGVFRVALVFVL
jgi:hypothetical protein